MKKIIIIISILAVVIVGIVILKNSPATSEIIWNMSKQGTWLLPLVLISAILDNF